jgi:hypothetical protein
MLVVLGSCPSAGASLILEYSDLAHRQLSPAPLVPTTAPKAVSPLVSTLGDITPIGRKGYRIRLLDVGELAPKAIIAMERGSVKSMAVAVRRARTSGFRIRSTRIRGLKGKLFNDRRRKPTYFSLAWKEKGAIYQVSSGTTKTISLKDLRSFIGGLQPLEREYVGTVCLSGFCHGAIAVTTPKTASVFVEWEATCDDPDGMGQALLGNAANALFNLLPRSGDSIGFGVAATADQPWTLDGTGTITPDAVTLNVRASGAPKGRPCDTGPLVLSLDQRFSD